MLNRLLRGLALTVAALLILVAVIRLFQAGGAGRTEMPDFGAIEDAGARKEAFFGFLEPFTEEANERILSQRERLLALLERVGDGRFNRRDRSWLVEMEAAYGLEPAGEEAAVTAARLRVLLERVDVIPPSLALAQAALESGWGTSRFAQEGNNLFGIWCYEPGCGIVPNRRPEGRTYEVAAYDTPEASFAAYMRNLNSNEAYRDMWRIRQGLREGGEPVTGVLLADGLYRYSQEGYTYIGKVQQVIRSNDLGSYDAAVQ